MPTRPKVHLQNAASEFLNAEYIRQWIWQDYRAKRELPAKLALKLLEHQD